MMTNFSKCIFCILFSVLSLNSLHAGGVKTYCLVKKSAFCSVSISRYEIFEGRQDIEEELSQKDLKTYVEVLSKYYESARKNNKDDILSLYSAGDGSRAKKESAMKRVPDMYASFFDVARVDINGLVRVSDYALASVSWYEDSGKFIGKWVELLYCPDECWMSDQLMSNISEVEFLRINTVGGGPVSDNDYEFVVKYPLGDNVEYYGEFSASVLYPKLDRSAFDSFNNRISSLFEEIRKEYSGLAAQGGNEFSKGILNILDSDWNNVSSETYVSVIQDGSVVGGSVVNLAVQVSQMDSFVPIMKFQGDEVDFYVYKAVLIGERNFIYIFSVRDGSIIFSQSDLSGVDSLVAQALLTSVVKDAIVDLSRSVTAQDSILK